MTRSHPATAGSRLALLVFVCSILPPGPLAGVTDARAGGCTQWDFIENSIVPPVIPIAPDGSLVYTVRVIGCYAPVQAARVNILFSTVGDSLVCWCNSSPWVPGTPHSFFATSDASGVATFHLTAGGCVENQLAAIPGDRNYAAEVFVDFVKLQECGVVSPDAVDNAGRLSTDSPAWDPAGSCATGLADAVFHTAPLANSTYRWCTDINGDHVVTLADGVILTPYLAAATTCAGNAGY